MGRPSHGRTLGIWANGLRVGRWTIPARGPSEFVYDADWVASPEGRPLSLSLPMNLDEPRVTGDRVGFFFDNLLPDSEAIRRRIQGRFATPKGDSFELLAAIGHDCVGAVQLLPDDRTPERVRKIDVTRLDDAAVEKVLRGVTADRGWSGLDDDEFRISIAGAQEKTALTRHQGHWCKPSGATPTTHIFKLPLGVVGGGRFDMTTSLENEWLCAQLLRHYGVPMATCEVGQFGPTKALIVTRFDRQLHASAKYWLRLPQEDFCQATGTPSHQKYESDGGPGVVEIARLLQGSLHRDEDLVTLMRAQVLFWMLAAIDGHAKNFSLRLLAQGRYHLAPLYDVISAWPIAGNKQGQIHPKKLKLAMALRDTHPHYRWAEIGRRHFLATARRSGLAQETMEAILREAVEMTPTVVAQVASELPKGFPAQVFEKVTSGLKSAASQLETTRD